MRATIEQSSLLIPAVSLPSGERSAPTGVDLTSYQGGVVRVYLSASGEVEVNPPGNSYWQIAEAMLPPPATETVIVGTREEVRIEQRMVTRSEGDEDLVALAENERIDAVGFSWARYEAGVDYSLTPAGLLWLSDRRPASADFMVDVAIATTVEATEGRPLPLDLAAHAVTLFDLPV